ncbi:uncharacterized CRISPR-associated protein, DUF2276 [Desulfosarcina variabilis str. Montpellier]|uniref:CRISPR system precrRNA processing endoribonuclease RAMP protein Cas6 n=1 Tax=Desulfosarcina variabilis TaxID=2300 RepID=UPI003AFAB4DA
MSATALGRERPFVFETFRFHLRMRTFNVLPPYKGALLRGALDNTFRRLACPLPREHCESCSLADQCIYIAMFHPPPPPDFPDAGKYGNAPPPFVLKPSVDNRQSYHPEYPLEFDLMLIGRALDAIPYFIYAIDRIGRRGLGRERGRYLLQQVTLCRNGQNPVIYSSDDQILKALPPKEPYTERPQSPVESVTLELQTPLRIKQRGKLVTRLDFATLFGALAHRLTLLSAFYGKNGTPDFTALLYQAKQIETVKDETFWYDWPRYSTRQKAMMKLGGLRGRISFAGDLTPFVSWLQLAERVHVGQGVTFGLGGTKLWFDL